MITLDELYRLVTETRQDVAALRGSVADQATTLARLDERIQSLRQTARQSGARWGRVGGLIGGAMGGLIGALASWMSQR